ncbi:MAG: hypothetical protein ABH807_02430 [Candidatus Shapirobacteria bacterium]
MTKSETVWQFILESALNERQNRFTQQDLALRLGYSLSTVNHAVASPTQIGALRKSGRYFTLENFSKLLYFWASWRHLHRDIIYSTYSSEPILEREGLLPPQAVLAAYGAARHWLIEPPADYDQLYFYLAPEQESEARHRYPPADKKLPANVIVLKKAAYFAANIDYTGLPLTFVDIWNLSDWYARDFTLALEVKINALLS